MAYHEKHDLSLKKGDKCPDVTEMQKDLLALGCEIGRADGDFGPRTEKAVRSFQERHLVNGVVDHDTASAIRSKVGTHEEAEPLEDIPLVPSPNFSSRKGRDIDLLVIHYTASGALDQTVRWFENPTANASAHYVLGKDGRLVRMVKEEEKAWHAGKSQWGGVPNCNDYSIGIEVVNWGILRKRGGKFYCWPGEYTQGYQGPAPVEAAGDFWEPYTEEQYRALIRLARGIVQRHAIPLNRVVGHSDIAPGRKVDPGPIFDWERFRSSRAL